MASTRKVWYVLVDGKGNAYKGATASSVYMSLDDHIARFKKTVYVENSPILPGIVPIQLRVYANKAAFDAENPVPLEEDSTVGTFGSSKKEALAVVVPSHDVVAVPGHDARTAGSPSKKQRFSLPTAYFQAFKNATLDKQCIISADGMILPYPNEKIQKIFVRKCYVDIFALFERKIQDGIDAFGISGTSGVGKSLFFVYILYRLVNQQLYQSSFKPKRIIYHTGLYFQIFDLEEYVVDGIDVLEACHLVEDPETFYIIDGIATVPAPSRCVVLFIASPRPTQYKEFVKQRKAQEWFLPVWTLNELYKCRQECYPHFNITTLDDRYRIFGGVAQPAFYPDDGAKMLDGMNASLSDENAVKSVRNIGIPTRIPPTAHMLLHIIVSDDGNYEFAYVDIASKYVGEQLWQKQSAQMVLNLQEMFGGSPNEISRHLFEIYGHRVFSQGGRTLKCRNLDDDSESNLVLRGFDGERVSFTRKSIPKKPIAHYYYEPSDDDTFPAIDSLSPQGMFQFTVGAEHPIRGVQILEDVCKAFDKPYKLYFVVPPHCFATFKKQEYKTTKGNDPVNPIPDLEQYVVELEVK